MRNLTARGAGSRHMARLVATAAFVCAAGVAASAHATLLTDPAHDRLPGFNGTTEDTPDLDVRSVSARYTATKLILSATMAGNIGTSDAGEYVWGVNRGQGSPLLAEPNPLTNTDDPIGDGVPFDAFIIVGNGVVSDEHDVNSGAFGVTLSAYDGSHVGAEIHPTGTFSLDASAVSIVGNRITLTLDRSLLASTGFKFEDYTYNLWPRYGNTSGNGAVTDFAPNNENFKASAAVPEPAAWAFMILGFGLAGTALRRRNLLPAA